MGQTDSRNISMTTYLENAVSFRDHFSSIDGGHCRLHARLPKIIKMVVLGCENTGKSTIIRQLRLLNGEKFSEEEIEYFKNTIRNNTWSAYKRLIKAIEHEVVNDCVINVIKLTPDYQQLIFSKDLVSNLEALKDFYLERSELNLLDRDLYFMTETRRIFNNKYMPIEKDILYCKTETFGLSESKIQKCCQEWLLIDTCGRKEERKNWIHCFEKVHAVLYVIGLNEYVMNEKFNESIKLLSQLSSAVWFRRTPMILLLNKVDKFRDLINVIPLSTVFDNDDVGSNFDDNCDFLKKYFNSFRPESEAIFTHFTCAIRRFSIELFSAKVSQIIISQNLGTQSIL